MMRYLIPCLLTLIPSYVKDQRFCTNVRLESLKILGADLSFLPDLRERGIQLYNANVIVKDTHEIPIEDGLNLVRFRLWTVENNPNSSLYRVKQLSSEIKSKGVKTFVGVHYSDYWTDPAKQSKFQKCSKLPYDKLKDSFVNYTAKICEELRPDSLQFGNEINYESLWPDCHINRENQMLELSGLGVKQVRSCSPDNKIIICHASTDGIEHYFWQIKKY